MARKSKTPKLKVLPLNPTGARKVPKPQVRPLVGSPDSPRGARARIDTNARGTKYL